MGEALIIKAGGDIYNKATGGGSSSGILQTEIFTESGTFIVPKAKNQSFSVRIFGGGGAGGIGIDKEALLASSKTNQMAHGGGGGGGYMNNAILTLNYGDAISVGIGCGGKATVGVISHGGTSAFGSYISALGGNGGGFTTSTNSVNGANGGSGGGGFNNIGGIGFQFGGGGGNRTDQFTANNISIYTGSGGIYGGGGGSRYAPNGVSRGGCIYDDLVNAFSINGFSGYGGNGGSNNKNAENGTNTIGLGLEFEGAGVGGNNCYIYAGGGGYGGNGGNYYGGGGGGYGGNGGNGSTKTNPLTGGGGGGYGADGGDADDEIPGGGGGYGKGGKGGSAGYPDGGIAAGGAGSKQRQNSQIYTNAGNGGNGICIIQYYSE